ncbi:MAG: carboxylate--amine ligase [Pseudomonadota bacterium]
MSDLDTTVPVLLLGGRENALAVARNLGRLGVTIYSSGKPGSRSMDSKYCTKAFVVPEGTLAADHWRKLLLSEPQPKLQGCLLFACCDESLDFLQSNRDQLSAQYKLEDFVPEQRRIMLDKQATLEIAGRIGVPAPAYWEINSDEDVEKIRDEVQLPVMVKPLDSFAFVHEFGAKLFIVDTTFDDVVEKVKLARAHGQDVMVVEMIPGPDDLLSSYYTYRTPDGRRLYDYTKSVIRRWPVNRGGACFHQSEWLPETAEMGQKLFDGVDWQGIGNVEFKRDTRDGKLKIIEVNARFTAAHRLVTAAGAPIDEIIYRHLTGQEIPTFDAYSNRLRMIYPIGDFMAYLELRQSKKLSLFAWLKSVFAQPVVVPDFSFSDPYPALAEWGLIVRRGFGKLFGIFRR